MIEVVEQSQKRLTFLTHFSLRTLSQVCVLQSHRGFHLVSGGLGNSSPGRNPPTGLLL